MGGVGLALLVACSSARTTGAGAIEPRFVAVHNALAAMGLMQVGPIQQGTLAEGREARVALDLPAGCVALAAVGGDGVRDLDATLVDARGVALAHDTTTEPQAVLRTCLDTPDAYTLVVKVASGAGSWVVAAWAGGGAIAGPVVAGGASIKPEPNGTCEAPIPLSPGSVSGSTTRGEHENTGSCGPSDSRELVYELDVTERQRVTLDVEARFDSVLYVRKDDCADPNGEVDCNDDAPDRTRSHLDRVLDPGKYFIFVDGYGHETGTFTLTLSQTAVLALADVCRGAPVLGAGGRQSASTAGMANDADATCGGGAGGADAAWRVELASKSRVRLVEHSDEVAPVVHLRRACADEQSEVACGDSGAGAGDAAVTGVFEAGSYTVFADARERDSAGRYGLLLETAPLAGLGVPSDGCGDATPLGAENVAGDTFAARDDVAGSCGGAGAPDVVYRLDVARRSRFIASLDGEEAPHVVVLWRRCADRGAEVACGRSVDEVVAPGSYFVGVDGASPDSMGRFTLAWALRDVTAQPSACQGAPTLIDGKIVSASTAGYADRFSTSCGATEATASGPDRVFRFELGRRATVRLVAVAPTFDVAVAVRRACADGVGRTGVSEIVCESDGDAAHRTTVKRTLEAGTYWVVVDGQSPTDQGPFTLEYRILE